MQRITLILMLLACMIILPVAPATALFFDNDTLVSIDGNNYTAEDFKHWWMFYKKEADTPLLKTPEPYIDWLLLTREAERMELASDPGFKRQTRIFLQSRTLLMLKSEEVNSRIEVSDDAVKTRYEERFLPRWLIRNLIFKNEKAATAAWQELDAGTLTVDELLGRQPEQGGPVSFNRTWLRPTSIDPKWTAIFQKLTIGAVADPSQHDNGSELYNLMEQKGVDEEDFAKWREEIQKDLWKEQENDLTRALLAKLRDKYQVQVDDERVAALDISAPADTFTDAAIITTSRQNFSERDFTAVIRKLISTRAGIAHAATSEELTRELKAETVENIISQSLTNWECLDRHYEEKEPFKWEYEFNYAYRLVTALENRLFASDAKVTEEEIQQHYQENIARYTQPEMANFYIIDETQGPIDQMWAETLTGKNFNQVLKQQTDLVVKLQEAPVNHLDPEVKAVVDKLAVGETSQIFSAQGIRVLVHLQERTPEEPIPLARVKDSIHRSLWTEKVDRMVSAYLDTIKSQTEIEIKQRQWKTIQKEFGGE